MRVLSELGKHCHPHVEFQFLDDGLVTSWTTLPSLFFFLIFYIFSLNAYTVFTSHSSLEMRNHQDTRGLHLAPTICPGPFPLRPRAAFASSVSVLFVQFFSWRVDHEAIDFTESVSFPSSVLPFLYHIQAGFLKSVF